MFSLTVAGHRSRTCPFTSISLSSEDSPNFLFNGFEIRRLSVGNRSPVIVASLGVVGTVTLVVGIILTSFAAARGMTVAVAVISGAFGSELVDKLLFPVSIQKQLNVFVVVFGKELLKCRDSVGEFAFVEIPFYFQQQAHQGLLLISAGFLGEPLGLSHVFEGYISHEVHHVISVFLNSVEVALQFALGLLVDWSDSVPDGLANVLLQPVHHEVHDFILVRLVADVTAHCIEGVVDNRQKHVDKNKHHRHSVRVEEDRTDDSVRLVQLFQGKLPQDCVHQRCAAAHERSKACHPLPENEAGELSEGEEGERVDDHEGEEFLGRVFDGLLQEGHAPIEAQ